MTKMPWYVPVCFGLLLGGLALPAMAAPTVVHQPPLEAHAGQAVALNATVTDPAEPITQVKLYYRATGSLGYQFQVMNGTGYNYAGTIPGSAIVGAGVDYYIEAQNRAGVLATSPVMNAAIAPHHLVVREAAGAPAIHLLMPEDGSALSPEEATVIVVSLDAGASRVDLSTLEVIYDEKNVTAACRVSETLVTFALPGKPEEGLHGLRVRVRNLEGAQAESPAWSFTVRKPGAPTPAPTPRTAAASFRANVALETQYAAMTKDSQTALYTAQPRGWLNRLNVNFNGEAGGLNYVGTAFVTSEEKPGRQPVDRLHLEFFDPGFNLTLGDQYPSFSPYSLDNLFVRGASLSLYTGPLAGSHSLFQMISGLTRIAVPGTYEQWLWGGRWRYDFLPGTGLGLNTVAVSDFRNSLPEEQMLGTDPAANWVLSGEGSAKVFWTPGLTTRLFAEYGLSYLDERMNITSISLNLGSFPLATALRGGMRWDWGGRSYFNLEYKDTGSRYVSLASPWLIGDWRGFTGDAQLYLLDDALAFNLTGNFWRDNLEGIKGPDTTNTTFLNGSVNYRAAAWLPSLTFGCSVNHQSNDWASAAFKETRTQVLNAGAGVQVPLGASQWLGNLNYSQTQNQTTNLAGSLNNTSSSFLASLMLLLGQDWSFTGGFGLMGLEAPASPRISYTVGNARANWKVLPGRFDLGAGWETLAGRGDSDALKNALTTLSLTGTTYLTPAQSLILTLSSIAFDDQLASANSYGEFVTNLRYAVNF